MGEVIELRKAEGGEKRLRSCQKKGGGEGGGKFLACFEIRATVG